MDDQYRLPNGRVPQTSGLLANPPPNDLPEVRPLRIPTVSQALPFTPFASIVPFNPEIITPPLASFISTPTTFSQSEDVVAARRELERLHTGAKNAEDAAKRSQKTLGDVQRLLAAETLTQYKFKTSKRVHSSGRSEGVKEPALSAFAKMVADSTTMSFRYLTPDSDFAGIGENIIVSPRRNVRSSTTATATATATAPTPQSRLDTPQPPHSQQQRVSQGQTSTIRPPQIVQARTPVVTAQQATLSPSHAQATPKAYVTLDNLTPAQLAEYQKVKGPDPTPIGGENMPSKNQSAYLTNGVRMTGAERRNADQAVEDLQSLLNDIFAAEDQLEPDTSGAVSTYATTYFTVREGNDGAVPMLKPDVRYRLDAALNKVVTLDRLDDVAVEHLDRVSRLCENAIATIGSASLLIGDDWSEDDIREWLGRITNAQNGLAATRTLMRIMTGGSRHKELQSEDHLHAVLDAVRTVVEGCIIPVAEERPILGERIRGEKNAPSNPKFEVATENRATLSGLINATLKCLRLLGDLFIKTTVDETAVSSVEYLCKVLIFAENGGTDKESALGLQRFGKLRIAAMDVLARIFEKYTDQRNFIIDEIIQSLERLPASKQSARQYQVVGEKPIQLVSALLMRFVHTSATPSVPKPGVDDEDEDDETPDVESSDGDQHSDNSEEQVKPSSRRKKNGRQLKAQNQTQDLASLYKPLRNDSVRHAKYVVSALLHRARTTSKSSTDEPFRKLLDIFTDDFINVLGSSDWPAAETMLEALVGQLFAIAENPKSPAPSRTLALELLGTIGSAIQELQSNTVTAARALDEDDLVSQLLIDHARRVESGDSDIAALTAFDGPYRVVLEYLHARNPENEAQLQTARGYHLVQWADRVCGETAQENAPAPSKDLQTKIRRMIEDVRWLEETNFQTISTAQGRLASKIVASNSRLCRAFDRIFAVILGSMRSEQPTVRSRSIKSVTILLEKDPGVLDRNRKVFEQIERCMSDKSPLVRDSALGLVQKCVSMRPALELKIYKSVITRTHDTAVGVRKRALAFIKQVYLRNTDVAVRAAICEALIGRVKDREESVSEVALTIIEDVWFAAFRDVMPGGDEWFDTQQQLRAEAGLIITTVKRGDDVAGVLEDLIKIVLTKSKHAAENIRVCKLLVETLFGAFITPDEIPDEPDQVSTLRAITVFAKAAPKMFTAAQIEMLEPHAKNLTSQDSLDIYHCVVNILRHALPVVHRPRPEFLNSLLRALISSVGKMPTSELKVIAPCVNTIDNVLEGTGLPLRLLRSALDGVSDAKNVDLSQDSKTATKIQRLLPIIGQFGRACNFDALLNELTMNPRYTWYKGKYAAGLIVEVVCKFTSPKQALPIREAALEAVCEVCQSRPELFQRTDVNNAIEAVFKSRNASLEAVVLRSLEDFFDPKEAGKDEQEILGTGVESGTQRLDNTYQATGYDQGTSSLSRHFLEEFLRIALASIDDIALSAARIVGRINTRGMAHPGDSAPALVALETCPSTAIAKLAFMAHKEQYAKHENVFEKGLVKAVHQAFEYQQKVVQDPSGTTGNPPISKLHYFWDIIKSGKPKVRSKLFTNTCAAMDFDPTTLDLSGSTPQHLLFVRFCVENFAFLDYDRVDDLLHLISCLEKNFSATGTAVCQAIESEVLQFQVPTTLAPIVEGAVDPAAVMSAGAAPVAQHIDSGRLNLLAVSAQVISLMWETRSYLRKLWNLQKYTGKAKNSKVASKEPRAPMRATNAPSLTEAYQNRIKAIMSMGPTEMELRAACSTFVDLFSIDNEVKVGSDDNDDTDLDDDENDDAGSEGSSRKSPSVGAGPRGNKRKSMDALSGPPKKKGRLRKFSSAKAVADEDGRN